jgi:MYXO-CTERM domain-containing protein
VTQSTTAPEIANGSRRKLGSDCRVLSGASNEGISMKKWYVVPALAGLLTIGAAGVAEATTPSTTPAQASSSDDGGDSGKVGLWGLLGLAGLAGLAGLKRRNDPYDKARYDTRDTTSTRTP